MDAKRIRPRRTAEIFRGALVGVSCLSAPAFAQESAVQSAADAFGERVGIEQVGLYNENQVRGFDLQASGAYRIEDAYFSKIVPLNDPVVAGVGVRVGVNAARLPYPAPSGVVNYRLRSPGSEDFLSIAGGLRDYGTRFVQADGAWHLPDGGIAGGIVWRPDARWQSGARGAALDAGLVVEQRLAPAHRLRGFAQFYWRNYDGEDAVAAAGDGLPPLEARTINYAPRWARYEALNVNAGLLYDGVVGPWAFSASAFRSYYEAEREDFAVAAVRADGRATGTLFISGPRTSVSDSGEVRVARLLGNGRFRHRLALSARARQSNVGLTSSLAVPLGEFEAGTRPGRVVVEEWSGISGRDRVNQVTGSLGYGVSLGSLAELQAAAHWTRYEKTRAGLGQAPSRGVHERLLGNASLLVTPTRRLRLFASWVTGLEESGVAPQNAANRNEVLAPVTARQWELGARYAITDGLALIAAGFEVSKSTMGLRPDSNVFGPIGRVRHRGVEVSLAGKLDQRTQIVVGAVAFQPTIEGPLVEAGIIGDEPVGVSSKVANLGLERELARGWSLDFQFTFQGARWVDAANTLRAPALRTVNLGIRHRFELAGKAAQLRVLASNIFDEERWAVGSSGLLSAAAPRTLRAILSYDLGRRTRSSD
ncbi:MAG: TonB-dependent receptor [Sphingomonas sp.]|uniref:TonB-dependent receptor domain-containing protein n=1 Tax=Sphingomonas sp. TaxID=28214 RepID=UPI001B080EE4|nr:TonB-dependent receptor [Sphingomonas sp.]MBO9621558.1 TonB-dependent receptor [Sphingomonas sp.]